MSNIEDESQKKLKDVPHFTEREAVLFLEKGGAQLLENQNEEKKCVMLDYHRYYLFKKKQRSTQLPSDKIDERKKLIALSEKEYKPIKKNMYLSSKKQKIFTEDEAYPCNCKPKLFTQSEADEILNNQYKDYKEEELFGCGGLCLNKVMNWECIESRCPCGISCRNRKFQNYEYADVYPFKTGDRGWGLKAGTFLPKDTFIIQYIGEIYSLDSEVGQAKLKEYGNSTCTYLMSLNKNEVIDPTKYGNMARFINHSCDPNCETKKFYVLGDLCIGIFTIKDIKEDEELTFDYGFNVCTTTYQKCLCGSEKCRGYLGCSTEENKKKSGICEICKETFKHSDALQECKICRSFFHKNCTKKKGQIINKEYKCAQCIKKEQNGGKKEEREKVQIADVPKYDEIYEVGIDELQKIKKNLGRLLNIGATLFWDYQNENNILGTAGKIELKISGTTKQIEGVKAEIKKLREEKDDKKDEFKLELKIPKIFVRKIMGHQSRNLSSYESKFNVKIEYEMTLITDDIFPIQETTNIKITGTESNVKAVAKDIKTYIFNLKVMSIYLLQEDYYFVRSNICNLKTQIDPADLRLRKIETKNERDIKHPFYYISNNNKDIVIIGFDKEVEKAEAVIRESIFRQNNISYNYSLSFLFPIYFKSQLGDFKKLKDQYIKENQLTIDSMEPEFLRRHISVTICGKWKNIIEIKKMLWDYLKKFAIDSNPKKHDIKEFEQYAYNQEHKLISKSIKTYIIEQNPQIKNWDYISEDIEYLQQKAFNRLDTINKKRPSLISLLEEDKKDEDSDEFADDVIDNFINTTDKETRVNYLLYLRPGAYKSVFKLSQNKLFSEVLAVLEETYESYNQSKCELNSINSETKPNFSMFDAKSDYNQIDKELKDKSQNNLPRRTNPIQRVGCINNLNSLGLSSNKANVSSCLSEKREPSNQKFEKSSSLANSPNDSNVKNENIQQTAQLNEGILNISNINTIRQSSTMISNNKNIPNHEHELNNPNSENMFYQGKPQREHPLNQLDDNKMNTYTNNYDNNRNKVYQSSNNFQNQNYYNSFNNNQYKKQINEENINSKTFLNKKTMRPDGYQNMNNSGINNMRYQYNQSDNINNNINKGYNKQYDYNYENKFYDKYNQPNQNNNYYRFNNYDKSKNSYPNQKRGNFGENYRRNYDYNNNNNMRSNMSMNSNYYEDKKNSINNSSSGGFVNYSNTNEMYSYNNNTFGYKRGNSRPRSSSENSNKRKHNNNSSMNNNNNNNNYYNNNNSKNYYNSGNGDYHSSYGNRGGKEYSKDSYNKDYHRDYNNNNSMGNRNYDYNNNKIGTNMNHFMPYNNGFNRQSNQKYFSSSSSKPGYSNFGNGNKRYFEDNKFLNDKRKPFVYRDKNYGNSMMYNSNRFDHSRSRSKNSSYSKNSNPGQKFNNNLD